MSPMGQTASLEGYYSLVYKLLKVLISKPLEILFNHSFSSGTVPSQFKLARVLPVFKNDPKQCVKLFGQFLY